MANVSNRRDVRLEHAQPARDSRDHPTPHQRRDPKTDPTARACQQRAATLERRAKHAARLRTHEATAIQRLTIHERAGPGTGDRQGEVA